MTNLTTSLIFSFYACSVSVCSKRIKKVDKKGKGLRHFSMKVCEKVQMKGTTSYNEVADELVAEFTHASSLASTDCVSTTYAEEGAANW